MDAKTAYRAHLQRMQHPYIQNRVDAPFEDAPLGSTVEPNPYPPHALSTPSNPHLIQSTQSYTVDSVPPVVATATERKPAAMATRPGDAREIIERPTDRDILIGRGKMASKHRE